MAWLDLLFIAVLVLSVLIGVLRGLVFELMSLVGWMVAYVAARWLSPEAAPHLPIGTPGSPLNHSGAFIVTFIAALLLWALLSRLMRLLVRATPLSGVDRLLGGLFGGVRGALLLLLAAALVSLTPLSRTVAWQDSRLAPGLVAALGPLKPLLPPSMSQRLPTD